MTKPNHPQFSHRGKAEAEDRLRRQAEALRANLARRKAQTRARADSETGGQPCPPDGPDLQKPER